MRIAVVGSGGTGGYFGGLLARAGEEVTFIARGAHLESLRLRGLTVKSRLAGNFTLPVRATDTPSEVDPVDLILFCVKTYDTDTAAHTIRPLIGADTMLLSLQNGVDNAERIAKIAGHEAGLGAVAYVVSAMEEPGVIAQTAGEDHTRRAGRRDERAHGRNDCKACCRERRSQQKFNPMSGSPSGRSTSLSAPSAASQPLPECPLGLS
jgi:2-dehydropantoate 2-reductase